MAGKKQSPGVPMTLAEVMKELESLGAERTKKVYINQGAREPLFGVTTGALKPLFKKIKINQPLAQELYATGNYDAMYLAGMIADPSLMSESDFDDWIKQAYWHGISDFIVAVTLAESPLAQKISDRWITSGEELVMSAGWNCYCWLLGSRPDEEFDQSKLLAMLHEVEKKIHQMPNRTRYAMNSFVLTVGISYLPLHDEAVKTAEAIGKVDVYMGKTSCKTPLATEYIQQAADKGRLGFKRKNVRC